MHMTIYQCTGSTQYVLNPLNSSWRVAQNMSEVRLFVIEAVPRTLLTPFLLYHHHHRHRRRRSRCRVSLFLSLSFLLPLRVQICNNN
jgi:hypothetical protein